MSAYATAYLCDRDLARLLNHKAHQLQRLALQFDVLATRQHVQHGDEAQRLERHETQQQRRLRKECVYRTIRRIKLGIMFHTRDEVIIDGLLF